MSRSNSSVTKGPWQNEEDDRLRQAERELNRNGVTPWGEIAKAVGTRSAKQCRERWHQNIKPNLNSSPFSDREIDLIMYYIRTVGKRWAEIARRLDNRSDNQVKNWFNGSHSRRMREQHGHTQDYRPMPMHMQQQLPDFPPSSHYQPHATYTYGSYGTHHPVQSQGYPGQQPAPYAMAVNRLAEQPDPHAHANNRLVQQLDPHAQTSNRYAEQPDPHAQTSNRYAAPSIHRDTYPEEGIRWSISSTPGYSHNWSSHPAGPHHTVQPPPRLDTAPSLYSNTHPLDDHRRSLSNVPDHMTDAGTPSTTHPQTPQVPEEERTIDPNIADPSSRRGSSHEVAYPPLQSPEQQRETRDTMAISKILGP